MREKAIKIRFVDWPISASNQWFESFDDWENNDIFKLLDKHYDLERSDTPDFLFFGPYSYEHLSYENCIKIMINGENIVPDFNICDYAAGTMGIEFEGRYSSFPASLFAGKMKSHYDYAIHKHRFSEYDFKAKTDFCSFVYSNGNAIERNELFTLLCNYKQVNSGGRYNNNVGGPVRDKLEFTKKHKFSFAFENSMNYTTEKIVDAFAAQTIPIYWGNPAITDTYNAKAFINVHDFNSYEDVVKKIIEIDNDDELYIKMLQEPAFVDPHPLTIEEHEKRLEDFLVGIIEKGADARRRPTWFFVEQHLDLLKWGASTLKRRQVLGHFLGKLASPIRHSKLANFARKKLYGYN